MANKILFNLDKIVPVYARDRILIARSKDGKNWEKCISPAINIGHKQKFDMAYWPFVWKENDKWRMVFSGSPNLRQSNRIFSLYQAESQNLINWSSPENLLVNQDYNTCPRIHFRDGNPLLMWSIGDSSPQIHSASLNDIAPTTKMVSIYHTGKKKDVYDFNISDGLLVGYNETPEPHFVLARETQPNNWNIFTTIRVKLPGHTFFNNPSIVKTNEKWIIVFRASQRTAWGSELWSIESTDLENWNSPVRIFSYDGKNRKNFNESSNIPPTFFNNYELGGVGFPTVIAHDDWLYIFYGGFWGAHLLMPYTYWCWK